jgi:hypothetical protein
MLVFNALASLANWLWEPDKKRRSQRFTKLGLEWLEDRVVPALLSTTWEGTKSSDWGLDANWSAGVPTDNYAVHLRLAKGGMNFAPTIAAGQSYTIASLDDDTAPGAVSGSLEIRGSLTIKAKAGEISNIVNWNISFTTSNATLDVQEPFTFSSAAGITSLTSRTGLLSIDGGGSMTLTGAAKQLDVNVNVGGSRGAGTLTFVDLTSNVKMKSGDSLTVFQGGLKIDLGEEGRGW